MRIDEKLKRKILVEIESDRKAGTGQGLDISVKGYDDETVAQHIKYLWDDGLIKGIDGRTQEAPNNIIVQAISPEGRRYLNATEPTMPDQ
jgi:hypothetical protein